MFLLRVFALLVIMRAVITVATLKRITARLGVSMEETPTDGLPAAQLRYARRVGRAIGRVAHLTPTDSNCYPQALTAWWLLHRKGIPTTFYYGAAFEENGSAIEAHVWLRCGPLLVTGGGVHQRYAPMTWFADYPGVSPAGCS
ncbi:MAG: lasso peptide biosynthesis B2 protein [Propionibacteriaceae bacterium]|nr:lasso peptide biosynthesis B2 protein [Propionibacteriaceae bacterium]